MNIAEKPGVVAKRPPLLWDAAGRHDEFRGIEPKDLGDAPQHGLIRGRAALAGENLGEE